MHNTRIIAYRTHLCNCVGEKLRLVGDPKLLKRQSDHVSALQRLCNSISELHVLHSIGEVSVRDRFDASDGVDELFLNAPCPPILLRDFDLFKRIITSTRTTDLECCARRIVCISIFNFDHTVGAMDPQIQLASECGHRGDCVVHRAATLHGSSAHRCDQGWRWLDDAHRHRGDA